jgi:hypothetical protein
MAEKKICQKDTLFMYTSSATEATSITFKKPLRVLRHNTNTMGIIKLTRHRPENEGLVCPCGG